MSEKQTKTAKSSSRSYVQLPMRNITDAEMEEAYKRGMVKGQKKKSFIQNIKLKEISKL